MIPITTIAMIQPHVASIKPRIDPSTRRILLPAQVTRLAYVKPVVARKRADEDAISVDISFFFWLIKEPTFLP